MHHIVRYIALFHVIQQINAIFPCPFSFYYKVEEKVPVWFLAVIALGSSAFLFVCFCVFFFNFWERSSKKLLGAWRIYCRSGTLCCAIVSAIRLSILCNCHDCKVCLNTTLSKWMCEYNTSKTQFWSLLANHAASCLAKSRAKWQVLFVEDFLKPHELCRVSLTCFCYIFHLYGCFALFSSSLFFLPLFFLIKSCIFSKDLLFITFSYKFISMMYLFLIKNLECAISKLHVCLGLLS